MEKQEDELLTNILSREEIDDLLLAINGNDSTVEEKQPKGELRRIQIFDFKRPNRFSEEQLQSLTELHKSLAPIWKGLFTKNFQRDIEIRFYCMDGLNYDEFTRILSNPAV